MTWHQHAVVKKLATFGQVFGYKPLANWSFSREDSWFPRGDMSPLCLKRYTLPPPLFFYRGNIELYECRVKIWNYSGFVWTFLYINWISGHLLCIIQIWTTTHAPMHQSWLKNHMCVLGWISRSHARDGNEFQTPGHCWLPAKHWDTWFFKF